MCMVDAIQLLNRVRVIRIWVGLTYCALCWWVTITEHFNIPEPELLNGAIPQSFCSFGLHCFAWLGVILAAVCGMIRFPCCQLLGRKVLGIRKLISMAVLGQDTLIHDKACQDINTDPNTKERCKPSLLPRPVIWNTDVDNGVFFSLQSFSNILVHLCISFPDSSSSAIKQSSSELISAAEKWEF